jgi:general secretion pathway protein D
VLVATASSSAAAQQRDSAATARSDSITIRLIDVDLRVAVQALSRYLDRPVVFGGVGNTRVTIETPRPVRASDIAPLLRGTLQSQGYELFADSAAGIYRVRQLEAPRPAVVEAPSAHTPTTGVQLYVIRLSHAHATEVAATVNALFGNGGALGELGDRRGQSPGTRGVAPPGVGRSLLDAAPPISGLQPNEAYAGSAPRSASLASEVTIVPDEHANSLLIRATPADYELLEAAVHQLDVRPLQVLIEVMIAEVRKDRSLSFGVDVTVPPQTIPHSGGAVVSGSTKGIGLGDFALRVMHVGGIDADIVLRAAASRGDATILSRPVLLAANNEPAEINVGSERPFVALTRVLPTSDATRDQIIDYKKVGTRLQVTPTISPDGYVMLQITQEVNAATTEQAFDAPVISTRSVSTRLLVRDGQTIVLGGLTDNQREKTQGGVPLLSSIPWLGGLFGRASRRATETELFLFVTPHIIRSDEEGDALTQPLKGSMEKKTHD